MLTQYRRWLYGLGLIGVLAETSGCYKATFYRDPQVVKGDEHEEWTNFYLFGLVGNESIDVARFCPPDRVAQVRTGANVGTGVIGVITLGIYTPHKIYVTCTAAGPAAPATALGGVTSAAEAHAGKELNQ